MKKEEVLKAEILKQFGTVKALADKINKPLSTTQLIVGHSQKTVTETVYTHVGIKELVDAVNKLE